MHAQDGYAVIAADGVGEFEVVGESRAGTMDDITLTPGKVAYITTGVCMLHSCCALSTVNLHHRQASLHVTVPFPELRHVSPER